VDRLARVAIGQKVRLLSRIGPFAARAEAVVISVTGDVWEIEIESERRLTIDCNDLGPVD
jgi:hypothetical protein